MVVLYLIQNTSGAKGPLSARKLGYGRTRHLRQEPFHDFVGVCLTLGSFYPKKHRLRANVRICAFVGACKKIHSVTTSRRTRVCPCSHNLRSCHGFNTCLIQSTGIPSIFHHFYQYWFHNVAFFPRYTLCSINSINTKGSKSATHSKQYVYMSSNDYVVFYLMKNTSGAKGRLSARKPRIRENQKFTPRTLPFHNFVGVC